MSNGKVEWYVVEEETQVVPGDKGRESCPYCDNDDLVDPRGMDFYQNIAFCGACGAMFCYVDDFHRAFQEAFDLTSRQTEHLLQKLAQTHVGSYGAYKHLVKARTGYGAFFFMYMPHQIKGEVVGYIHGLCA